VPRSAREADPAAACGIRLYCEEVKRAPRLSPVKAHRLLGRVRRGDTKALDMMVLGSLRLVAEALEGDWPTDVGPFTLLEAGNQALVRAITSFDSSVGREFEDYARSCIHRALARPAPSAG
jgi:DNA-directed RNA polymerase sigma subunit (sigma70/sigma32)